MNETGFWWILLAAALYGVLHSVLAGNRFKARAQRWVGAPAYRRLYRLFFSIQAVVTLLPVLGLVALLPDRVLYAIPAPWVYLTVLVQVLAAAGVGLGVLQTGAMDFLGLRQLAGVGEAAPARLVVSGLYRWVRHPLYTFSYLFLWLVPVMTWNLLALNIAFSAYLWIGSIFEERKLLQDFGQEYAAYRQATPRFVPKLPWKGTTG